MKNDKKKSTFGDKLTTVVLSVVSGLVTFMVFITSVVAVYMFVDQIAIYSVQRLINSGSQQEVAQYMAMLNLHIAIVGPIVTGFVFYYLSKVKVYRWTHDFLKRFLVRDKDVKENAE